MYKTLLSDELQWDIIDILAEYHPRALTKEVFVEVFGEVPDEQMMINVMELISCGIIKERAILKLLRGPTINISQLLLTESGYLQACAEDN